MLLASIDWTGFVTFEKPLLETFLRGTVVYLTILIMLRVLLKRQAGDVGLGDMLLLVLIADASQNAMANEYRTIPDGLLLIGTLIFWNFALDWLSYRWPAFRRLIDPSELQLIRDGRVLTESLRQECITEEELLAQLRMKGFAGPADVRAGYIEGDGRFSFLPSVAAPAPPSQWRDAIAWHHARINEHQRAVMELISRN